MQILTAVNFTYREATFKDLTRQDIVVIKPVDPSSQGKVLQVQTCAADITTLDDLQKFISGTNTPAYNGFYDVGTVTPMEKP